VAYVCNPITWEENQEDHGLKTIQVNSSKDLVTKNNQSKNWTEGVAQAVVAPALYVQNPEFKSQSHQ
jgi:hypothetical protein